MAAVHTHKQLFSRFSLAGLAGDLSNISKEIFEDCWNSTYLFITHLVLNEQYQELKMKQWKLVIGTVDSIKNSVLSELI